MVWIGCDACSSRAYLRAFLAINPNRLSPLHFCGYHARKQKEALNGNGWLLELLPMSEPVRSEGDTATGTEATRMREWLEEIVDVKPIKR